MTKGREAIEIYRGDILWIQCDPSVGVEPQKIRTWASHYRRPHLSIYGRACPPHLYGSIQATASRLLGSFFIGLASLGG